MKHFNKIKYILITILLIITKYFHDSYWTNLIDKKITHPYMKNIFIILSFVIFILLLIPKNKESIKKYKIDIIFFLYILILDYIFILSNKLDYTPLLFFSISFSNILIITITSLFSKKAKDIINHIIIIVLPIYIIIQSLYLSIFNEFFSFVELVTLKEGLEYKDGIMSFNYIFIVYVLLCVLTIYLYNKYNDKIKNKFDYKILIITVVLYFLININLQQPIKEARLHTSDKYLYTEAYSNKKFVARFGTTNYLGRDIYKILTSFKKNKYDYKKELDTYFKNNKKEHIKNEYTGLFEGKNLVFIISESLDNIAINETLTPNLYKLKNEGIIFNNHFIPVFPRTTCDSEIIYNTSIIPSITDGPTCFMFNNNSYKYSLSNIFKNKGYITNAFHSNEKEFYTRNVLYKNLGYDKFYDQKDLKLTNKTKRYDSVFFNKAKDYMLKEDQLFFAEVITLSGHSPYTSDHLAGKKHIDEVKEYFKDKDTPEDKILYYLATQIELDHLVEDLIKDLSDKNILDNTVIILTSDHYPYTLGKSTYEKYTNISEDYLKNKGMLYIWNNKIKHEVFDDVSQSFDLLPTIANLFNLDTDYTYYFGNDLFDKDRFKVAFFKDYSWFDGDNYVKDDVLIKGSGNDKYINNTSIKIKEFYDISIKVLRSNYLK